ncbi:uncharacterized protein LOC132275925 [Cornus florida]|uniref:uncharacterized protein LOC132275925 n=1 Tax=Cornus florida TaxID=4283 RepID=UPI00289ED31B|nr:uncharacterized protein LOC132275925 [Cornus florida]XP_059633109.1 uncharacterized protein LOC132275925 [Cornus florida]XP_059633110.1 uncharacterized protein LOC132275925 [Cornus florida]
MRKLYDEYINKENPGRAKSLPFSHLITQILIDQPYPIHPREHPERGSSHYRKKNWNKTYRFIITRLQDHAILAAVELELEEQAQAQAEAAAAHPVPDDAPVDLAAEHLDIDLERPADDVEQDSATRSPIHEQEQTQELSSDSSMPETPDMTPDFGVRLQTLEDAVVSIRANLTAHRADFAAFHTDVATMFRDLSRDIRGARPACPTLSS